MDATFEIVRVLDERSLINAESYQCSYLTAQGEGLPPGCYAVMWDSRDVFRGSLSAGFDSNQSAASSARLNSIHAVHAAAALETSVTFKESAMANLTRWEPFADFGRVNLWDDSMDRFMRRMLRPMRIKGEEALDIAIDVTENDNAYVVKAEIPGVNKEDINVSINGNQVGISAEVKREREEKKGEKVLYSERYAGSLYRGFTLPSEVDQAKAEAKYANGVLALTLPKKAGGGVKKLEVH
jgi:HSP20 family protein